MPGRPGGPGVVRHLDLGQLLVVLGRLAEQVLLDPVGEPGDADAEQAYAAGGVEVGEQAAREPGDRRRGVGGRGEGRGPAQRGEVVHPHLDRDRATRQPALAQPAGDVAGLAGQQVLHQAAVGQVVVVGALDADRLGLALGDDRPVVVGAGERVQPVPAGLAEQPRPARPRSAARARRRCAPRPGAAARRWPGRRRGSR